MLLLTASLIPLVATAPAVASKSWKTSSITVTAALLLSSTVLLLAAPLKPVEEYNVERTLDLVVLDGSGFNILFAILASLMCAVQAIVSPHFVGRRVGGVDNRIYYALFALSSSALLTTPLSGSLTTFFLLFESYLLSTWLLLMLTCKHRAREAAYRYLLFTEAGALVTLLGLVLVYDEFGTFRFEQLSVRVPTPEVAALLLPLLLAAPLVKVAVVPLHAWLLDVYSAAPPPLIGMVTAAECVAGWAITRLLHLWPAVDGALSATLPLVTLGVSTALYGNLNALAQSDYRRLLAYATIGGSGLLLVAVACSRASLASVVFLSFEHALARSTLLVTLGYLEERLETRLITQLGGLASSAPRSALGTFIAALSLAGVPPTLGFWAELAVLAGVASLMGTGFVGIAVMILVATALVLCAAYSLWLFKRVFFGETRAVLSETWCSTTLVSLLLSLSLVALGVYPAILTKLL